MQRSKAYFILERFWATATDEEREALGIAQRDIQFVDLIPDDVMAVVRCKDCKHWKKGDFMGGDTPDSMEYGGGCPLVRFARYESDFCSKGERNDGD